MKPAYNYHDSKEVLQTCQIRTDKEGVGLLVGKTCA